MLLRERAYVETSPDGLTLASGGDREDRTVILWDMAVSATTPAALIYFSSVNGDYLSGEVFLAVPVVEKNYVTLESASLAAPSDGYGTLATITFQVVDAKASGVFLSQATLVDPDGERFFPCIETDTMEDGAVIETVDRAEDINDDGVVNIQDLVLVSANFGKTGESKADVNGVVNIVDLVKVAAAIRNTATAPF